MATVLPANASAGYCAGTTYAPPDCERGTKGAWLLSKSARASWDAALAACASHCARCARCEFISFSPKLGDCSWFNQCPTNLRREPNGFVTAKAVRVPTLPTLAEQERAIATVHAAVKAETDAEHERVAQWTSEAQRSLVATYLAQLDVAVAPPRRHRAHQAISPAGRTPSSAARRAPLLVLGVLTTPKDATQRDCVRATTRSTATAASTRAPDRDGDLVYRFVVGGLGIASTAALTAEHATHGDIALLPRARDGRKSHLSRKVLEWFAWALSHWPAASFFGKADMDTLIVWARLRHHLLQAEARMRRSVPIHLDEERRAPMFFYVGLMEWSSLQPRAPRVCGCCGSTERHAKLLQRTPDAHFGPCFRRSDHPEDTETHGPFPFAQGGFYALSGALVAWAFPSGELGHSSNGLVESARVDQRRSNADSTMRGGTASTQGSFAGLGSAEDIITGYLISHLNTFNHSLELVRFNHAGYQYEFANELAPRSMQWRLSAACPRTMRVANLSVSDLTTGTLSPGSRPEVVSPAAVALHRVGTCEQRRRAWALATSWTARLAAWGEPQCVYTGARKLGRRRAGRYLWQGERHVST